MRRSWLAVALAGVALFWWLAGSRTPPAAPVLEDDREARLAPDEVRAELAPVLLDAPAVLEQVLPEEPASSRREPAAPVAAPARAPRVLVLEGRVLLCAAGDPPESGVPLADVEVRPSEGSLAMLGAFSRAGIEGMAQAPASWTARTASDGSFRLALPEDGTRPCKFVLFTAQDERFLDARLTLMLAPGETRRTGLEIVCYADGELTGRTLDTQGRPLAGVEVHLDASALHPGSTLRGLEEREVASTVFSDSDGRFRFERVSRVPQIGATKPGYTLLGDNRSSQRPDGTWDPLELVLAPTGTLRVRVTDPAGVPALDFRVAVENLSSAERYRADGKPLVDRKLGFTDHDGVAQVPEIWTDQRLRLWLSSGDKDLLSDPPDSFSQPIERVDGARAVLGDAGVPLVLVPGEEREIQVVLAAHWWISGQVVGEHAPPVLPLVTVVSTDAPLQALGLSRSVLACDEQGHFELELLSLLPLGRVRLEALDMSEGDEKSVRAATTVLNLTGRASGREEVTLVLQPRQ